MNRETALIHVWMCTAHVVLCFVSQAETRAEFAERSVAKLEKTIDDLEGIQHSCTSTDTYNTSALCTAVNNETSISNKHLHSSAVGTEVMTGRVLYCAYNWWSHWWLEVLIDLTVITAYLVHFIGLFLVGKCTTRTSFTYNNIMILQVVQWQAKGVNVYSTA